MHLFLEDTYKKAYEAMSYCSKCNDMTDLLVNCHFCGDICMECSSDGLSTYCICNVCHKPFGFCDCYSCEEEFSENAICVELCHSCAIKYGLIGENGRVVPFSELEIKILSKLNQHIEETNLGVTLDELKQNVSLHDIRLLSKWGVPYKWSHGKLFYSKDSYLKKRIKWEECNIYDSYLVFVKFLTIDEFIELTKDKF